MRVNSIHSKFSRLVPFLRARPSSSCYKFYLFFFFIYIFFSLSTHPRCAHHCAENRAWFPLLFSTLGSRGPITYARRAFRSRRTPPEAALFRRRISVFSFSVCFVFRQHQQHIPPCQILLFFFKKKYGSTQAIDTCHLLYLQRYL